MHKIKFQGKDLEKILPHKNPMILIDRVVDYDLENKKLTSEVDINAKNIFFDQELNAVPIWVGIEFMAQTIGCLSGIYAKEYKRTKIDLGFVIGARNYECFAPNFKNGQCLKIEIEQLFFDSELGAFECVIKDGDKILAQAQLNVFQPESAKDFLKTI
ncbi:MAG: putative hotdog family 3-hydroxylacyl-ACP dehydratase [Rickettsiales bacterium]|jgi:predicted hotdog family 3-hydroxylacyl-ACP dehydratase